MIPAQRRASILEMVRRHGAAGIGDLADRIGASSSTVRRDLEFLTRQGYLVRSHGGAMLQEPERTTFEVSHEIGAHVAQAAKQAIGRAAAALVEPGQSVVFDSSSTVQEAARVVVAARMPLTAVTNDLGTAMILAAAPALRVVVVGGTVRPDSLTLFGDPGQSFLEGLHFDLAFVGIHSFARQRLSETSIELVAMKRRMIGSARRVAVLADSSKLRHPAFCEVGPIGGIDMLVVDSGIPDAERQAIEALGVTVIVAPLPENA